MPANVDKEADVLRNSNQTNASKYISKTPSPCPGIRVFEMYDFCKQNT